METSLMQYSTSTLTRTYASLWEAELMETASLSAQVQTPHRQEMYASLWEVELMETDCNVYCSRFLYVGNIAKPRHCFTDPRLLASFHLSLFGEV